jgi:hypothetical protein
MVYAAALTVKKDYPDWSNRSCLESAFIRCAGMSNYNAPIETMLPEFRKNPDGDISQYIVPKVKTINP